jgi:hypothetical protein
MLALLAHKWNWKKQHQHNPPRTAKDRPYLIIGTHTHACFAKFARYFEVGVKWICLEPGQYAITADQVKAILEKKIVDDAQVMEDCGIPRKWSSARVGELVMAVGCVVCTTFAADMDDVAGIDRVLTTGGWNIRYTSCRLWWFYLAVYPPGTLRWDFRWRTSSRSMCRITNTGWCIPAWGRGVSDATVYRRTARVLTIWWGHAQLQPQFFQSQQRRSAPIL